ncbi:S1-like domain-containing RNA-binding protein [Desulfuromonas sp. CSMB_57]|uniref:CvfB family protein n=1 Tax=Desulfuromonas sp. CSMB_57 TaxID=2807629 RepID=UPI001CD42638|nr:S1-like domain-containing RNA-binding protein [Desulfuromonas sp. CSMB_57]
MLDIGRVQILTIDHIDHRGAWLRAGDTQVLLPARQVPEGSRPGSDVSVFLYLHAGEPMATIRRPLAQVGEFALLKVNKADQQGTFMEWGLEKELLVPFSEQPDRMREGRHYLVRVCLDDQGRCFASGRIQKWLETDNIELQEGQPVDLILWQFTDLGAKVIVNHRYGALLYRTEVRSGMKPGDRLKGFVKAVRPDGKVDVTRSRGGKEDTELAVATLLAALEPEGFVPWKDDTPAEIIQRNLGMSKKLFKKAVGGLYKAGRIELTGDGIRLKKS